MWNWYDDVLMIEIVWLVVYKVEQYNGLKLETAPYDVNKAHPLCEIQR